MKLTSSCFLLTGESGHVLIAASDQRTCSQLREVCQLFLDVRLNEEYLMATIVEVFILYYEIRK